MVASAEFAARPLLSPPYVRADVFSRVPRASSRASLSRSSMTSVPKPLKFLRPHLQTLKDAYAKYAEGENKKLLADIISLLAMTNATHEEGTIPESLKFRMLGSKEDIGTWGHEVLGTNPRHLTFFFKFLFVPCSRSVGPFTRKARTSAPRELASVRCTETHLTFALFSLSSSPSLPFHNS